VQGDTGFGWVDGNNITMAAGFDWLKQTYNSDYDSISQAGGFAGAGGPSLPLNGSIEVTEFFMEANVPVLGEMGFLDSLALDLGYRYSDYNLSGPENTYKIAMIGKMGWVSFNGGYNRAIRAPNLSELFATNQIALYNGDDGCAGVIDSDPDTFSPIYTQAQCALTGMTAAQYGNTTESPAGQYNQFIGGNQNITPEQADTWTFGFDFAPIEGLAVGIDYYDITVKNQIGTLGAQFILDSCIESGGNAGLCSKIQRNPANGNLWQGEIGQIINTVDNFGEISTSGIDLNANYTWDWLDGRWMASFVSTYVIDFKQEPLKGIVDSASYDCAGVISTSCATNDFRAITELRYTNELFSVNTRWRYISSISSDDGSQVLAQGGTSIPAYSLFDLSGSINVNEQVTITMGVNNIFDKEPPLVIPALAQNANFPGGYDAAGQFFFANVGVTF
jgi:outer membrane receptor protein involved in Fe transport